MLQQNSVKLEISLIAGQVDSGFAQSYWSTDSGGKWAEKPHALEDRFNIRRGTLHRFAEEHCFADALDLFCPRCNASLGIRWGTRIAYSKFLQSLENAKPESRANILTCNDCKIVMLNERKEKTKRKKGHDLSIIKGWLSDEARLKSKVEFNSLGVMRAFFLICILDGEGSSSIGLGRALCPEVFASESDVHEVLSLLLGAGLIAPSSANSVDAFRVKRGSPEVLDPLIIEWQLQGLDAAASTADIITAAKDRLNSAALSELREVWRWVCLSELHAHLMWCERDFGIGIRGVTPSLSAAVLEALEDYTLPQVKTAVWRACESLKKYRSSFDPDIPTRNLVGVSFNRTLRFFRGKNWVFYGWKEDQLLSCTRLFFGQFDREYCDSYKSFLGRHLD